MDEKIKTVTIPLEMLVAMLEDTWASAQNCGRVGLGNKLARQAWVGRQALEASDWEHKAQEGRPIDAIECEPNQARGHFRG